MAKTNKSVKNLTKKQLSRRRREEQQLLWVWASVAAIAVVVLIVIGIGVVSQLTRTVAIVNGERIRATEYEKRVRFYYYSLGPDLFEDEQGNVSTETHQQIVDLLIDEALVRQEAAKRNITATQEEIEIAMEERWFQHYRNPPTPTPSPTVDPQATATPEATPTPEGATPAPTATSTPTYEEQYDMFVDNVLRPARVSEAYIRDMAEVTVLRDKLAEAVVQELPDEEDQVNLRYSGAADAEQAANMIAAYQAGVRDEVNARHILVATQEEAAAVLERLNAGEDFAALAAELSLDTGSKDQGGDLGWFPRGQMVAEFETAAFEGEIGLVPEPVQTEHGFHVIEILGHEERPIDLDTEMFELGWYTRSAMARDFGELFAEMIMTAEIGLFPEPVPTNYGVAVIEVLGREVRPITEEEKASRSDELFQDWLDEVAEEGAVENLWTEKMIPTRL